MLQAWVYWQRCQRSDLWSPLLAPSPGMQLERTPGVQLSNESLPTQCLPGDPLGLEMRTVYQAVIRMALSFLQDFPASLGPTSTAWLWEGLDSEACSGVGPILVPTRASEEAGTQPQHTLPELCPGEDQTFCSGLGRRCSPPTGTAASVETGKGRSRRLAHVSCSRRPPPHRVLSRSV